MTSHKIYRRHNCDRKHRTFQTLAKCVWPKAYWTTGEGPFALLAWCGDLTVTLWSTAEEVEQQKVVIDKTACGHACTRRHEIIKLEF